MHRKIYHCVWIVVEEELMGAMALLATVSPQCGLDPLPMLAGE